MKKVLGTAFILFLVPFLFACPEAAAKNGGGLEEVRLSVYTPEGDSAYLPHLVAAARSYFKDNGIDLRVSIEEGNRPLVESDLYLMGRTQVYQIEASSPGLIQAFNINTQDKSNWNDAILVRNRLDISSLGQLESEMVAMLGGGPARAVLVRKLLEQSGLNPANFPLRTIDHRRISLATTTAAQDEFLEVKLAAANIGYFREPFVQLVLGTGDWRVLRAGPLFAETFFSPWPMSMTVASSEFLEKRPETARKAIAAYDEAISFIRKRPGKARKILSAFLKKKYGKKLKPGICNYLRSREVSADLLQKQSDWYFENGMTVRKIEAGKLLYIAPAD